MNLFNAIRRSLTINRHAHQVAFDAATLAEAGSSAAAWQCIAAWPQHQDAILAALATHYGCDNHTIRNYVISWQHAYTRECMGVNRTRTARW